MVQSGHHKDKLIAKNIAVPDAEMLEKDVDSNVHHDTELGNTVQCVSIDLITANNTRDAKAKPTGWKKVATITDAVIKERTTSTQV